MVNLPTRISSKFQVAPTGCWLWKAATNPDGYGRVGVGRKVYLAHRLIYQLSIGEIPEGLVLHHECETRNCVNPAHLTLVTRRENNLQGNSPFAQHARKTHCPQGHPYNEENTRHRRGSRECRQCSVVRARRKYRRMREAIA